MSRKRKVLWAFGVFAAGLATFRIFFLPDLLTRNLAEASSGDDRVPTDAGLPYEDASFAVGEDTLVAWFVTPPSPRPVAFLLLHGDGETVSDWIEVQRLLHDRGHASLVYDFAGYGNSGGSPSTRLFDVEPRAALDALLARIDPSAEVCVLGHSFGAAVAVEAFHDHEEPRLRCLIFNAGPPSLRDIMREILGVPGVVTALLPNLVNAKVHAGELDMPVLVIASEGDELFSTEMIRRVYDGASEPKELLIHPDSDHNELTRADPGWWKPLLEWVDGLETAPG